VSRFRFGLPRTTRARIVFILALAGFAIVALANYPLPDYSKMRAPNANETFIQYVAFELDAPALCEKLAQSAILPGGIFIARSYARSECYATIARRYNQPALCWHAHRLGSISILDEQVSPIACWLQVERNAPDPSLSTYMPSPTDLNSIFAAMGYRAGELYREGVTPPLPNPQDTYRRLAEEPDLVDRIVRITSTSTVLTQAERMRLFDLAAHTTGDPSWCSRISADWIDPGSVRNLRGPTLFERDRCILEIASNTRRPEVCRQIPDRADDFPGLMSRRARCEQQAGKPPDKYHYGARPPEDYDESRRIIAILGYPLPDVSTVPASEIASAYYYFVWQIARDDSAAARAARAKFLARVGALPSYN